MHNREDLYNLSSQFKELQRWRRRLDNSVVYENDYADNLSSIWHFCCMIVMYAFGIFYFIGRICLCKLSPHRIMPKAKRAWSRKKKKKGHTFHVHSTVLNLDKKVQDEAVSFDTDSVTAVCDNSANVHICNNESMFIGEIRKTDKHYVATIGGQKNAATGMGTVRWEWKDDNGKQHTYDIEDTLYFPSSPVNILSVTSFAEQLKDDDGTGIDTKRSRSTFIGRTISISAPSFILLLTSLK